MSPFMTPLKNCLIIYFPPDILVMVLSAFDNVEARETIRYSMIRTTRDKMGGPQGLISKSESTGLQ